MPILLFYVAIPATLELLRVKFWYLEAEMIHESLHFLRTGIKDKNFTIWKNVFLHIPLFKTVYLFLFKDQSWKHCFDTVIDGVTEVQESAQGGCELIRNKSGFLKGVRQSLLQSAAGYVEVQEEFEHMSHLLSDKLPVTPKSAFCKKKHFYLDSFNPVLNFYPSSITVPAVCGLFPFYVCIQHSLKWRL